MTIIIPDHVIDRIGVIAISSDIGHAEIARIAAYLNETAQEIMADKTLDFWNVADSAAGILEISGASKNGVPIWRLYPKHKHAIALVMREGDSITVVDVGNKEELAASEKLLK